MIELAPSKAMMDDVIVPAFIFVAVSSVISAESISVATEPISEVQGPLLPELSKDLTLP